MKMQETVKGGLDPGFGSIWVHMVPQAAAWLGSIWIQMVPQAAACKKRLTAAWIRDLDPLGVIWIQKL